MASSNPVQLTERDQKLYDQLDGFSTTLRHTAEKFADYLMQFNNQLPEIRILIKTLDSIIITPIENLDIAILDLEKIISTTNSKLADKDVISPLFNEKKLTELSKLNEEIALRATELAKKAMELNGYLS